MAKRYFTMRLNPRMADMDGYPDAEGYLSRTVFETDPTPYPTGILDSYGDPLYAAYELDPVGYVRWSDE